ncbi:MAG: ADP-ribosylglycohydrolase family protein [Oscillospiraceae bacterium]
MKKELVVSILEALAVGDSYGKSTEFASRAQILSKFKSIDRLLKPSESLAHTDMRYAQVTDDTEQNVFLIEDYSKSGKITPEIAAQSILRWYDESPEPQKYIGPSTSKALDAIRAGNPVEETGKSGASCGGVMRAPAAFLCSNSLETLQKNVFATLCPTHNTAAAMEAAMGYAYALWAMGTSTDITYITNFAKEGCIYGRAMVCQTMDLACAPACDMRITHILSVWNTFKTQENLIDFLFYVYGTTISSCDVFVAAYALFLWAKSDVFLAIKMATMLGGDTDTIACLAAVLCCAYAKKHNIPQNILNDVKTNNCIDFDKTAQYVLDFHK